MAAYYPRTGAPDRNEGQALPLNVLNIVESYCLTLDLDAPKGGGGREDFPLKGSAFGA